MEIFFAVSEKPKDKKPRAKTQRAVTDIKIRIMARTGMLPLDFLTAVYRNQLYTQYEERVASDGVTMYYEPSPGARQLRVNLQQRVHCAIAAAPYVHKKMPVGIEVQGKNRNLIDAEKLRTMSIDEVGKLLGFFDALGIEPMVAAPTEEGEERLIGSGVAHES